MTGSAIRVEGLSDFRRELRQVDNALDKEMRAAHRKIASRVQSKARSNASAAGGAYARSKTAIRGSSSATFADVGLNRRTSQEFAAATFFGALKRTGWYAAAKYAGSEGRQFPEWVGNTWEAARYDQGPYVINYTVAEERDDIEEPYLDAMDDLFGRAFPRPSI